MYLYKRTDSHLWGLFASVFLMFLKGRYHPLKPASRDCQMPEVTRRSYISIFRKVLCVTADRGFIFNPLWMHSQNEQKMPFGGFYSAQPTISHQSGLRSAGNRLENSSVPLHLIHFNVVKLVMGFSPKHNQILLQADFDWRYLWYLSLVFQHWTAPMSRVLQEPHSKCVHRVSLAARWRWRRSWASRATPRSKLLSPGLAPPYSPRSDRDTTTLTVSIRARHQQTLHFTALLPSRSGSTCMCSMICDGLSHLPSHCLKRRHPVCVCRPVHLSLTVSARGLGILLHTARSSTTRFRPPLERHACLWTDHTRLQI